MNSNIQTLLNEYEYKRQLEINKANQRKTEAYKKYPDLEKIENDIRDLSIKVIKASLTSTDKQTIDEMNNKIMILKNKKTELLKKYKLSDNYFLPQYECKKCKDTGYIDSRNGGKDLCNCIKQKLYNIAYNNSNIYDLENQNFQNFSLDYYSDEVNEKKYSSDISPKDNIASIKKMSENFINNFDDPKESNLLFCGNTGLGKTFLSSCIANEVIKNGKTVLYQTAPIMLDRIIDYKFGKSKDDISKTIYSVDLLIIDDLGTETKNNYRMEELFNIINSRILNQNNKITKTIISTNLSLQELYDTYEERIVSRIIGNYNACYFYGEDIRVKKKLAIK